MPTEEHDPKKTPPVEQPPQAKPSPKEVLESGATPAPASAAQVPSGTIRMDLHCHSEASADCRTPLKALLERAIAKGIHVQAITDHNEIWGALKLRELAQGTPLTVIVGEEVSTREGEIIGLFLHEKIPAGLSPEETVERIKAQGGLVLLPHGFDPLKRHRLHPLALQRVADQIDIVESFNAHISRPTWNRRAAQWAKERGLPVSAGSDAHTLVSIGAAWVQTPARAVQTPQDLLVALREGTVMGEWTHPAWAFVLKMWDFGRRRLARLTNPEMAEAVDGR